MKIHVFCLRILAFVDSSFQPIVDIEYSPHFVFFEDFRAFLTFHNYNNANIVALFPFFYVRLLLRGFPDVELKV